MDDEDYDGRTVGRRGRGPDGRIMLAVQSSARSRSGYLDPIHQMEWPRNSGEYVRANNSLTDSAGLAGLEVEVFTPDGRKRAADARTFHGRRNLACGPVRIEEYGEVQVFARLRRHDALTAEGHVSWTVDADGYEKWQVLIVRIAHPGYADESLRCGVMCVKVEHIAIGGQAPARMGGLTADSYSIAISSISKMRTWFGPMFVPAPSAP